MYITPGSPGYIPEYIGIPGICGGTAVVVVGVVPVSGNGWLGLVVGGGSSPSVTVLTEVLLDLPSCTRLSISSFSI